MTTRKAMRPAECTPLAIASTGLLLADTYIVDQLQNGHHNLLSALLLGTAGLLLLAMGLGLFIFVGYNALLAGELRAYTQPVTIALVGAGLVIVLIELVNLPEGRAVYLATLGSTLAAVLVAAAFARGGSAAQVQDLAQPVQDPTQREL